MLLRGSDALTALGGLLVTGVGIGTGLSVRQWHRNHSRILSAFGQALSRMGAELSRRETDTLELLEHLEQEDRLLNRFFHLCREGLEQTPERSLARLWEQALTDAALPLREEEYRLLSQAGQILGRYDGRTQAELLEGIGRELEQRRRMAVERDAQQGRLALLLGGVLGLLVTLLCWPG